MSSHFGYLSLSSRDSTTQTPLPTAFAGACKSGYRQHILSGSDSSTHSFVSSPTVYNQLLPNGSDVISRKKPKKSLKYLPCRSCTKEHGKLKRFSKLWWRCNWNRQVDQKKLPRLLYIIPGVICLVVWLAIAAAFSYNLQFCEGINATFNYTAVSGFEPESGILFFMRGQLNSFDQVTRNLNLDWSALMIPGPLVTSNFDDVTAVSVEEYGDSPLAIFRDTIARPDPDAQDQSDPSSSVPFRLKNPNVKPIGYLGVSDFDTINTDIGLSQRWKNILTQPEFGYPWDIYEGTIVFVAANNTTISKTDRPGSGVQTLYGAVITDSLLNYKVETTTTSTCLDSDGKGCELIIHIRLGRTGLVKFCVIVVVIINWTVTIAIFMIAGEALLVRRQDILAETDILAVCFSALFALPSVRSLLPGVPGYGCLMDLVGILPNVIIVALCTTFFTNSRLRQRRRGSSEPSTKA